MQIKLCRTSETNIILYVNYISIKHANQILFYAHFKLETAVKLCGSLSLRSSPAHPTPAGGPGGRGAQARPWERSGGQRGFMAAVLQ